MKDKISILLILTAIFAIVGVSYGVWHLQKRWNYAWSYEDQVKQTIREMVKEEALKEKK